MRSLRSRLCVLLPVFVLAVPAAAFAGSGGTSAPSSDPSTAVHNGGSSAEDGGSSLPGQSTPSQQTESGRGTGGGVRPGTPSGQPEPTTPAPVTTGVLLPNGKAKAPKSAPAAVKKAIRAGNRLLGKPYVYGGGHVRWNDVGYDCSGAVSYALRGGRLLNSPLTSGDLMRWAIDGPGKWNTTYSNPNHTFIVIAGLRLDTGAPDARGPRWYTTMRPTGAFTARHPRGL